MSTLKSHEKVVMEKIFDRSGYVLNFSDKTFSEFFREHAIDIDDIRYRFNGQSKMKRLRAFWEIEPDGSVGHVLKALLEYACATEEIQDKDTRNALNIIKRLLGQNPQSDLELFNDDVFIDQEFSPIDLTRLNLDEQFLDIINQRIEEIHKTLISNSALSVLFLCGSTLEGLLLDLVTKNAQIFNQTKSAPKDRDGKTKLFHDWTLNSLITTAHELGILSLDVKKHSHSLRDFRNYIHPRQQLAQQFSPDEHTAKIAWQVLQAAIADLCKTR